MRSGSLLVEAQPRGTLGRDEAATGGPGAAQSANIIGTSEDCPADLDDFSVMDVAFSMFADGSNNPGIITGPTS
jgi:hypothetical protein